MLCAEDPEMVLLRFVSLQLVIKVSIRVGTASYVKQRHVQYPSNDVRAHKSGAYCLIVRDGSVAKANETGKSQCYVVVVCFVSGKKDVQATSK